MTENCEICGKPIELDLYAEYVYKRRKGNKTYYFCGFNCRKKWDGRKKIPERSKQ